MLLLPMIEGTLKTCARSSRQATQQAAANEAAAMASSTAKGISDGVMAAARQEAADAQDAAQNGK